MTAVRYPTRYAWLPPCPQTAIRADIVRLIPNTRIHDIQAKLPKVQPLFERAEKPPLRFGPTAA